MPPNILWICTDQQRRDTLGCYGNPFVRTPNLDALARSGIQFENAFCQNPVCTPSRASFLTGRYPRTTRARQNGQQIPSDEILVTRMLADHGYTCGLAGKLHLSPMHPKHPARSERRIDDGYSTFHFSHHPWPDPRKDNEYIDWLTSKGATFKTPPFRGSKYVESGMPPELHHTTWCADRAIDFIQKQSASNN